MASDLLLTGATAYPSPDARPIPDAVIVIQGGRIAAVRPKASVKVPKQARVLDCSGQSIVAGFWNSHVHIFTPGLLRARDAGPAELNAQLDAMFNCWGFSTVFDVASVLDNTLALRRRIESGELRGPRLLIAGEPLWTESPVYVRDFRTAHRIQIPALTTAADAAARVRALARGGADGIKLFTGAVQGGGKVANMPLDFVRAAGRRSPSPPSPWNRARDRRQRQHPRTPHARFPALDARTRRPAQEGPYGSDPDPDAV